MYRLIIADDEPLVQVGIRSMIDWSALGIEVAGTAGNGQAALRLIEEQLPDLVITDIKMPVMDGLELIRTCRERYADDAPVFMILTSYEDFHMVREALTYQVSDYLVKVELTPDNLRDAVSKALDTLRKTREVRTGSMDELVRPFHDKFLIRLLNNMFESEEQFLLQSRDLGLSFDHRSYICCSGEFCTDSAEPLPVRQQLPLYANAVRMLCELCAKYMPCYGLALDMRHFALIFCDDGQTDVFTPSTLSDMLSGIGETLRKYYNVRFSCGIGTLVSTPLAISDSYQCSRQAGRSLCNGMGISTFDSLPDSGGSAHYSFNISLFRDDITRAFEEYDPEALSRTVATVCELFRDHPDHFVQSLDAASSILYLSISLLPDGESTIAGLYTDDPDGYRSLYKQNDVDHVLRWLETFSGHLCRLFEERRRDHKNHIVTSVKKYISAHVRERLTLNETAAVFGISPNYLSQLFGRYNDLGFTEYINACKIAESKRLLDTGTYKVFEVADMLGFESSFYFSRVFKKLEGISPSDYVNR